MGNDFLTVAFFKPFGVVSQFTPEGGHQTLAAFDLPKGIYSVGRLDHDSEGLLLLTGDNRLKHRLTDPAFEHPKTYWVQVEGAPEENQLALLRSGVVVQGQKTRPAEVSLIETPVLPPRNPPVRFRKTVPDAWLEITLTEGRNRQIRRMTAAVGLPTLRLIRVRQAGLFLFEMDLLPGQWKPVYIGVNTADKQL
jgi:23S rRNA pseudouridine2457 synthase